MQHEGRCTGAAEPPAITILALVYLAMILRHHGSPRVLEREERRCAYNKG